MDIRQLISTNLAQADAIANAYIADLSDVELLSRPIPGINHIAWQLGHLISSEHYFVNAAAPGKIDPLAKDFQARHTRETAALDSGFLTKAQYLEMAKKVRADTLRIIGSLPLEQFDREVTGMPPMCKTAGDTLIFIGVHWLMHAGQWAVIRRKLGRPALF